MKKNYILITLLAIAFVWSGCDSYLDTEPKQQIPSGEAYSDPVGAEVALNGLYNQLGGYRLLGNYAISMGDFCADLSVADGSSGHFVAMNTYSFTDTSDELLQIWYYGYKVISGSTALLASIDNLVEEFPLDKSKLESVRAQAYALRAYTYFKLVNIFGLPYGTDTNPNGGLVLMDTEPIPFEADVSRSSVSKTYEQVEKDIKAAKTAFGNTDVSLNQYYMNEAALYALSARVALFKKDYPVAITEAQKAIDLRDVAPLDNDKYKDIWKTTAISAEDIFTIVKTNDDNLSANAINTLYGSYGATVTQSLLDDFADTDVRKDLFDGTSPLKFAGIPSAAAVNNIPQFRVSEMYLIIAEAKASAPAADLPGAAEALLYTAKRNTAITTIADLPTDKDGLLAFIAKERKREFFQEGHRLFDVRRTGEIITVANGQYINFDAQKFVFPIPSSEINSGFKCEQNEGWFNNMPEEEEDEDA